MSSADRLNRSNGPEFFSELLAIITSALRDSTGLASTSPDKAAEEIVKRIAKYYGGQRVYVPKGTYGHALPWYAVAERNWKIFREYTGTRPPFDELCARYQISRSRLYQILHWCRDELEARRAREEQTGGRLRAD